MHGFHWVEDRRQHLVVDVYQQQRFVGGLWGLRRHRRYPVSDVADLVPAEDGEVPQNLALKETAGVISRDDGLYTGDSPGYCGVESADSGVGVGTAKYLAGQHAGQDDVGGIYGLAGDLIRTVDAANGLPDDFRLENHLFLSLCPLFKGPFCHPEQSEGSRCFCRASLNRTTRLLVGCGLLGMTTGRRIHSALTGFTQPANPWGPRRAGRWAQVPEPSVVPAADIPWERRSRTCTRRTRSRSS